jgi:hypothetical protein
MRTLGAVSESSLIVNLSPWPFSVVFSRSKTLDIRGYPFQRPRVALLNLKQLRRIKILRVTDVVLMPVPLDTRLPLFSTLREIYLKDAPTEWMSGHVFMNLAVLSIFIPRCHEEFHFNAEQGVTCLVWTSRATKSSRVLEGTWGPWRHSTGLETRRYLLR